MSAPVLFNLEHITDRVNADGSKRYYFRRRGQPICRLPGEPLSDEFMAVYRRCEAWTAPSVALQEGTFAWVCDQYMNCLAFTSKAEATRAARRRIINSMLKERIDQAHPETFAHEAVKGLKRAHIEVLRDRKADNPNAANERMKILRQIFKFAVSKQWMEVNLARDAENLRTPKGGHETATNEQLAAYFAFHKSGTAHLAMTILKETGVRVSDLRVLGRQHVKNGVLVFKTKKTDMLCELPISAELHAALPRDNMTFLLSELGQPFKSDKAMSARVAKWFRQAGVDDVTAHGVRKWLATKMAENGTTEWQLCASFGWRDPKEARPYVQAASRQKMAREAFAKISNV